MPAGCRFGKAPAYNLTDPSRPLRRLDINGQRQRAQTSGRRYPFDVLPWLLYPYPFIDVGELGYPRVLANWALIILGFLILAFCFIAVDRVLGRRAPSHAAV